VRTNGKGNGMTHLPDFSRRTALAYLGAGASLMSARGCLTQPRFTESPFTLGVAAGDPTSTGLVIWTRLALAPLEPNNGLSAARIPVRWEVGSDANFNDVVRSGEAVAERQWGYSVHVEVEALQPGRPYYYRFASGGQTSPTGRAKTAPPIDAPLDRVRMAMAGCQKFSEGYYTAHRELAKEDLDFIFFYGDYIYEARTPPEDWEHPNPDSPQAIGRVHLGSECLNLAEYRQRYSQYTMDADLQASRASAAWFVTYDDHEINNNWTGRKPAYEAAKGLARRAAAMQAWYEFMPVRKSVRPQGSAVPLYRRAVYGDLVDLNLLDTRQFRTEQPCGTAIYCEDVDSPDADVLGKAQETWLFNALNNSKAQWKVLAQQVVMMDIDRDKSPGYLVASDSWAGYRVPRSRLLSYIKDREMSDVVVLTGDVHRHLAGELYVDGRNPEGPPVATEFVGTSISSGGNGSDLNGRNRRMLEANPQLRFVNGQRGYAVCEITPERWKTDFKVLDKVSDPNGTMSTRSSLAVATGDARIVSS